MNWFETYDKLEYNLISKKEGINVIKKFYQKMKVDDINYYLNTNLIKVSDYIENAIIEPKDFELSNLLNSYFKICKEKLFNLNNKLINFKKINICITKEKVYWDDIFTLGNIIFINYPILIEIFYKSEINYNSLSEVFVTDQGIYDIDLIKKLFKSMLFIGINNNLESWKDYISMQFNCDVLYKNDITYQFKPDVKTFLNPNTNFASDIFFISYSDDNKTFITLDIIHPSTMKYQPYIDPISFDVKLIDNIFIFEKCDNPITFTSNPFVDLVERITNIIFV